MKTIRQNMVHEQIFIFVIFWLTQSLVKELSFGSHTKISRGSLAQ